MYINIATSTTFNKNNNKTNEHNESRKKEQHYSFKITPTLQSYYKYIRWISILLAKLKTESKKTEREKKINKSNQQFKKQNKKNTRAFTTNFPSISYGL